MELLLSQENIDIHAITKVFFSFDSSIFISDESFQEGNNALHLACRSRDPKGKKISAILLQRGVSAETQNSHVFFFELLFSYFL